MKLAFVVSWLNQYGGAERVLEAAHALFPDAPIFTSMYAPEAMPAAYRQWDIRVSFLDRVPLIHRHHQLFLPFYPQAFQSLDLRGYDVVLSITSAFAHGVNKPAAARHLCYCLTPARFLWQYREYVDKEAVNPAVRTLLPAMVGPLRAWDRRAAARVDEFIAISRVVQQRIASAYGRRAEIIYPPVEVSSFDIVPSDEIGDYYLIMSRLIPYKRIDLAVEAFNRTGLPLIIAGDGRDRARLERMAKSNIKFVGRVSDRERFGLMARCRAFVFPGEEDFGIAPIEANAAGRPVIAYAGGGALDTVVEGLNGILFRDPSSESLAACLQMFDAPQFDPLAIRAHAEQYDTRVFQEAMTRAVSRGVNGSNHRQQATKNVAAQSQPALTQKE